MAHQSKRLDYAHPGLNLVLDKLASVRNPKSPT